MVRKVRAREDRKGEAKGYRKGQGTMGMVGPRDDGRAVLGVAHMRLVACDV